MTLQLQDEDTSRLPLLSDGSAPNQPARASVRLSWGSARYEADAEITPLGLLAIGGMVGAILLAVAPIVTAAGRARKRR